jgi:hypothetical protein
MITRGRRRTPRSRGPAAPPLSVVSLPLVRPHHSGDRPKTLTRACEPAARRFAADRSTSANRSRSRSVWAPADSQTDTRIADDAVRGRAQSARSFEARLCSPITIRSADCSARAPQDMRVGFVGRDKVLETQIGPADVFRGPTQPSRGVALQTAPERVHRAPASSRCARRRANRPNARIPASMGRQYRRVMETTERRGRSPPHTRQCEMARAHRRPGCPAARRARAARLSQHLRSPIRRRTDRTRFFRACPSRSHPPASSRRLPGCGTTGPSATEISTSGPVPGKVHKGLELSAIRIAQISGQIESRPWPGGRGATRCPRPRSPSGARSQTG